MDKRELFKIVMKHERFVPQYISEKIIEDYITALLSDRKHYPKIPESFWFELTVRDTFWGNPLISEGRKIASPHSKNIPSSRCKLEFEIMKVTAGVLYMSGITIADGNQKIKVTISGIANTYYLEIEVVKLKRLLQRYTVDTISRPYADGEKILAVMIVDKQILMDNCTSIQK